MCYLLLNNAAVHKQGCNYISHLEQDGAVFLTTYAYKLGLYYFHLTPKR